MVELGFYVGDSCTFHIAGKLRISGIPLLGLLLQLFRLASIHSR